MAGKGEREKIRRKKKGVGGHSRKEANVERKTKEKKKGLWGGTGLTGVNEGERVHCENMYKTERTHKSGRITGRSARRAGWNEEKDSRLSKKPGTTRRLSETANSLVDWGEKGAGERDT